MARRKVPSQAASGAETFSNNLVGVQITDGSSQLTNTNFAIDKVIPEKDSKTFSTSPFSDFLTVEKLNQEYKSTTSTSVQSSSTKSDEIKFRTSKDSANKSLFGSLKNRLLVSIQNIIKTYPAAILVDSDSPIIVQPETAKNIVYYPKTNITEFEVEVAKFFNPFDVIIKTPKSGIITPSDNIIRDFYSSFKKYVVEVEGTSYDIQTYREPNEFNVVKLSIVGSPFTGSTYLDSFLIRPNDGVVEEFYDGVDDLESILINRDTNPRFTSTFKVPRDSFDTTRTEIQSVKYTWPLSKDNWNPQIVGLKYEEYLTNLNNIADEIDNYKSNLFVRFMSSPQLYDFDTEDKKAETVFQLYGQNFDRVKKFIDNIAYMRNVSYDAINNLPDVLLKNLANTLGLDSVNFFDEKTLGETFYSRIASQYSGITAGMNMVEAEYEFYRRILVNIAYLYKSKGTRKSIEFLLKFLGIPDPMISINEYVYEITSTPKSSDIESVIYDTIAGTNTSSYAQYDTTTSGYTIVTTTGSTSFTREQYPINQDTGLPKKISTNDIFFQKGFGWYETSLSHRSSTELDTENSVLTGLTKTLKTKNKNPTYGEEYFDAYRTLPGLDTGYQLQSKIDNTKSDVVSSQSPFILNRKNISVFVNPSNAIDYDIYKKSRDLNISFGTSTLTPQTGVTFAEFLNKVLNEQIKNSNTIKYKKNYIALEDIYNSYVVNNSFTSYDIPTLNEFINAVGPYWTKIVEQFIPSTTLWTGGNLIKNSLFGRPKYQYKRGCEIVNVTEYLYPEFEATIEEDVETILGKEENFRGLTILSGVTYTPIIEVDGVSYTGSTISVTGSTLFSPFTQNSCTSLSTSSTNLPLICEYKDYLNPNETSIKSSWITSVVNLITNVINNPTKILDYQLKTGQTGSEKIIFTPLKTSPNECSFNDIDYKFISDYKTDYTECGLQIDFITYCEYTNSISGCNISSNVYIQVSGNYIGVQDGDTPPIWPVYVHVNGVPGSNENITTLPSGVTLTLPTGLTCTYRLSNVKEFDVIDFNFTDGANCDVKVKLKGLQYQITTSIPTGEGYYDDGYGCSYYGYNPGTGYTSCIGAGYYDDGYGCAYYGDDPGVGYTPCSGLTTGYTAVPIIQYRPSFDYGIKEDTKILVLSGATINTGTTPANITSYISGGTLVYKNAEDIVSGDTILTAVYKTSINNGDYVDALNNNDFSFSYHYSARTISEVDYIGSIKTNTITVRPLDGPDDGSQDITIEVLPTTKLRVYTDKDVNAATGVITQTNYSFVSRFAEYLVTKGTNTITDCCSSFDKGDYLISMTGELFETISVNLEYCEAKLYYLFNFTGTQPTELITFNGPSGNTMLLEHTYIDFTLSDFDLQQYNITPPATPPPVSALTRTDLSVYCTQTPTSPGCDPIP